MQERNVCTQVPPQMKGMVDGEAGKRKGCMYYALLDPTHKRLSLDLAGLVLYMLKRWKCAYESKGR